jgi:hypothetical protein
MTPTPPKENPLAPDHEKAMKSLKGQSGAEFDRAYAAEEVRYHQQVIDAINGTLLPALSGRRRQGPEACSGRGEPRGRPMPRALTRRRLSAPACLIILLATTAGCHKLRSQLGGGGAAAPDVASSADSSSKPKHLHLLGGGGKKSHPAAAGLTSPDSREPSEAALARHSRRSAAPMFHWNAGAGGDRHKGHPGD